MAVIVKRWDDVGAAVLNGVAGSLIAVLDDVLVTAAGWSKVFSGTNLAVYRAPVGGNQMYLRVDDTYGTYARIVGYESMTDVNTGTNAFPTNTQVTGGLYVAKADTTATTARQWIIAVTDRLFHMWRNVTATGTSPGSYGGMWSFGDIKSLLPADAYGAMLIGQGGTTYSANYYPNQANLSPGHFLARPYTGIAGAIQAGKVGDLVTSSISSTIGNYGFTYPNPADGGVYVAPLRIVESSAAVLRGTIPGVWQLLHPINSMQNLDTFSGTGVFAGKTFINLQQYNGAILLETSNTWDV